MNIIPYPARTRDFWLLMTRALALAVLAFCLWSAWTFPVAKIELTVALAVYAALLLRWPAAWLIVVPLALPILELTFWSGRLFFGEFDLLVLVTIASGLWYGGDWWRHMDRGTRNVGIILLLSQVGVTLHGLLPLYTPVPSTWTDYFASTNALREFRGVAWALLLWPMLAAAQARGDDIQRWLTIGLLCGLTAAAATIVWERALFTGLFSFSHSYRISGWFFSMHTGGAAIDAFLALSVPFALAPLFFWNRLEVRATTVAFVLMSLYAFYVTYSRANYPALFVMLTVLAWGLYAAGNQGRRSRGRIGMVFVAGGVAVMLVLGSAAIVLGPQIQERFGTTQKDLAVRFQHWSHAIDVATQEPSAALIGRGKGRFPVDYYWHHETAGKHLALAQLHTEGDKRFMRFSRSDDAGNLFLQQRFERTPSNNYTLKLALRIPEGRTEGLLVEFCERHILKYRTECRWRKVLLSKSDGEWQEFSTSVDLAGLGDPKFGPFTRPLDVSLMNRGIRSGMDIGYAQLLAASGEPLLSNADFSQGWDHWFLTYGDHLRWHIKNVFVYWFYEGGIFYLLLLSGLTLFVGLRLIRETRRGNLFALLSLVAVFGTLMVGLFDSLFDDTRISTLYFTLIGAALISQPHPPQLVPHMPLWLTRQRLVFAVRVAALAIVALVALRLVMPSLFQPLEIRIAVWAEKRGSFVADLLAVDHSADIAEQLANVVAKWKPLRDLDVAPGEILIGSRTYKSFDKAVSKLRKGDHMIIGAGVYRRPLIIGPDDVWVTGSGHVVIERTQAQGKAAIITQGNNIRISNIECRYIAVSDRNGACVRQQGRHLTLDHVYFHDSEQGVLTGSRPGRLHVLDSRFEQLGKLGLAHGIYMGRGSELLIQDSEILAARSWGHEIKSGAAVTRIIRSRVASLASNDSRLLDLPHGGRLEIRDSVLQHGPNSANKEAIGFGLEGKPHNTQEIVLEGNIVILERNGPNQLLRLGDITPALQIDHNVFVNADDIDDGGGNLNFDSRDEISLPPYPALPELPSARH